MALASGASPDLEIEGYFLFRLKESLLVPTNAGGRSGVKSVGFLEDILHEAIMRSVRLQCLSKCLWRSLSLIPHRWTIAWIHTPLLVHSVVANLVRLPHVVES